MRAMRYVRAWCQPGQQGSLGLGLIVSLLLLGGHTPVVAQTALLGKTQSAIGTLVVIRPDRIEDRLQGQGALQREQGDAGGNCKTPVEWPVLCICHSNPEKPPYAYQTATHHV
jgi:hypothetical protein